jgi:hypothetical protein
MRLLAEEEFFMGGPGAPSFLPTKKGTFLSTGTK